MRRLRKLIYNNLNINILNILINFLSIRKCYNPHEHNRPKHHRSIQILQHYFIPENYFFHLLINSYLQKKE